MFRTRPEIAHSSQHSRHGGWVNRCVPRDPASPDPPGGGVVSFPGECAEALLRLGPGLRVPDEPLWLTVGAGTDQDPGT
jgi:hypothetical protein